jgi:Alpha-N-acetylglucosaminidase (NAGLU).
MGHDRTEEHRNRDSMKIISTEMLDILDDVDTLLGTQTYFLVEKWISDARSWGASPAEQDYFESNARNILTTWSDKDQLLNYYACRTWNGLVKTFYKMRWQKFFDAEWDDAHYKAYSDDVTTFEKDWWEKRIGHFTAVPVGDSRTLAKKIYEKYKDRI